MVTCRQSRPGALVILPNLQVMSTSNNMTVTGGNGVEISIPSTPSDEMGTDVNRHEVSLSTGDHRGGHNPMNIMSLNTTIMPPSQGNLEPNEFFDKMLEKFSNTIMMQAQDALRQQWHMLQQSSQAHQQAHQQQVEYAVQTERASNYSQHIART